MAADVLATQWSKPSTAMALTLSARDIPGSAPEGVEYTLDDVMKWKHFPRYWPFVRGIHRSPVNSPHKGQWRGALMFTLICVWINSCVNNREAGDLRRYRVHYDVTLMHIIGYGLWFGSWMRKYDARNIQCWNRYMLFGKLHNTCGLAGYDMTLPLPTHIFF